MNSWILNKELNQAEAAEGKIVLGSRPRTLMAILTTKCNLKCIMCTRVKLKPQSLPLEAVERFYSLFAYLERVDWQGGEVFLVDYFKDLFLKTASFPHILQNINTNALLIDKEWAEIFAHSNVSLLCSIDSVVKATYETIRYGGRFENLLNSLDLINEADKNYNGKVNLDLVAVVMKRNYRELSLFPEFCKKYNFRSLLLDALWPELIPEENILSDPDIDTVKHLKDQLKKVEQECKRYHIHFHCTFESHLRGDTGQEDRLNKREDIICPNDERNLQFDLTCSAPWNNVFIDVDGQVRPECKCFRSLGNIKCNTLEEAWNGEVMRLYRNAIKNREADSICSDMCKFYATLDRREKKAEKVSQ